MSTSSIHQTFTSPDVEGWKVKCTTCGWEEGGIATQPFARKIGDKHLEEFNGRKPDGRGFDPFNLDLVERRSMPVHLRLSVPNSDIYPVAACGWLNSLGALWTGDPDEVQRCVICQTKAQEFKEGSGG